MMIGEKKNTTRRTYISGAMKYDGRQQTAEKINVTKRMQKIREEKTEKDKGEGREPACGGHGT